MSLMAASTFASSPVHEDPRGVKRPESAGVEGLGGVITLNAVELDSGHSFLTGQACLALIFFPLRRDRRR